MGKFLNQTVFHGMIEGFPLKSWRFPALQGLGAASVGGSGQVLHSGTGRGVGDGLGSDHYAMHQEKANEFLSSVHLDL